MYFRKLFFFKVISYVLISASFVGCGSVKTNTNATIYDRNGVDVIIESTTGNSFLLTDEKIRDQFCMSPPPDLNDAKSTSGSLAVKGVSISEGTALSVAALGGRSPAVLISREIMYRTCELYVNSRLTKEESISIFKASLDRVVEVTKAQISQGTTTQIGGNSASNSSKSSAAAADGSGTAPGVAQDSFGAASGVAQDGSGAASGGAASGVAQDGSGAALGGAASGGAASGGAATDSTPARGAGS